MTGAEIIEWRISRGWTLEDAAIQIGLPSSKLKAMEGAKKLSIRDERLAEIFIAGSAMLRMFESASRNQRNILDALNKEANNSASKF